MDIAALHPFLKTKAEANKLIQMLESLNNELFKEDFNLSKTLTVNASYELKTSLEESIQGSGINPDDRNNLKSYFASLQGEITSLPVAHMILALSPSEEIVNTLHNWFYQSFKKIVLLDISIDKSLIAGSVISFKGRANDYSLSNQIEQIR